MIGEAAGNSGDSREGGASTRADENLCRRALGRISGGGNIRPASSLSAVHPDSEDAHFEMRRRAYRSLQGAEQRCAQLLALEHAATRHLACAQDAASEGTRLPIQY
mmetsp:Transcript_9531/g.22909  ORF Transcript_9531/g.22909 Transcript_9531/m.22909 type:complete len:106 (-) Transcript_9531:398-715(-)